MLGVHVTKASNVLDDKSLADDLSDAILRDLGTLDLNCAQVFTHGPKTLSPNKIDFDKVVEATTEIDLSVHSAHPTVGIWRLTDGKSASDKKRLDALKIQLMAASKL
jgi:hypothetical protein